MKLSAFLSIKAVMCFVFGIPMLLAPMGVMPLFGVALDPPGALMTRFFGVALIAVGLICWFLRDAAESATRRDVLLALFVGDTLGFIVALAGQRAGLMNPLGWVVVAIWLLLALGLGYFRFLRPAAA